MTASFRRPTRLRSLLAALAVVALGVRLLFPAGFMPGTSLAQPIVWCDGQGPAAMPGMAHGHAPDMSHAGDHACPFAVAATTPTTPDSPVPLAVLAPVDLALLAPRLAAAVPGRGLAAPPPPSHAPPRSRA